MKSNTLKRGKKLKINIYSTPTESNQLAANSTSPNSETAQMAQSEVTTTVAPAKQQSAPANSKKKPTAKTTSKPTAYKVKSGDTLSAIATRHGITVAQLMNANGLKSDKLQIGQNLSIPNKAPVKKASSKKKTTKKR